MYASGNSGHHRMTSHILWLGRRSARSYPNTPRRSFWPAPIPTSTTRAIHNHHSASTSSNFELAQSILNVSLKKWFKVTLSIGARTHCANVSLLDMRPFPLTPIRSANLVTSNAPLGSCSQDWPRFQASDLARPSVAESESREPGTLLVNKIAALSHGLDGAAARSVHVKPTIVGGSDITVSKDTYPLVEKISGTLLDFIPSHEVQAHSVLGHTKARHIERSGRDVAGPR